MSPAFFALVRKDLRLFLQDRRALLLNLLAPVLIAAFFGSLFGGSGSAGKPSRIPVAVTDLDGSPGSTQVLDALREFRGAALGVALFAFRMPRSRKCPRRCATTARSARSPVPAPIA